MCSKRGSGAGNRRGNAAGAEDDAGEPSERAKPRSDNQKKKGNIGRPRNKPPPLPREAPVPIIPRPEDNELHRKRRRSPSPAAGASNQTSRPRTTGYHATSSTDIARNHKSTDLARERPPRKLTDNLKPDEYLTTVWLLAPNGIWVDVPNCLVSPNWNHSFIFPETVEAFGYGPIIRPDALSHKSVTPRGDNINNRIVGLYMELKETNIPEKLILLPIFNKRKLGVSIVLGRPFIDNWSSSVDTQYVAGDWEADMPTYDMDQATWPYGFGDCDDGAGIYTAMDPNVYLPNMGSHSINHDLTAVGTGIPAEYPEFTPDWDGYLQEN